MSMGRHVMEALGMSRVVLEDGKVVEVSEPKVRYCPLFDKYRGIKELNTDTVRENMEFRMRSFGMCCDDRQVRMSDFLTFGISELMSLALSEGSVDAVVTAADGCGTCVLTDPEIVQGMGGRISGIVETSPIAGVIDAIGPDNVVDPETTPIDMRRGAALAVSKGYRRFAVTVASADDAEFLRREYGDRAVIFAVHTTGVSREDALRYYECADVITACASKWIRELAPEHATVQAGTKVPVYGASEFGKRVIEAKLRELGRTADTELTSDPMPLL